MVENKTNTDQKNRIYVVNDIAMVPPAQASGFHSNSQLVSKYFITITSGNGAYSSLNTLTGSMQFSHANNAASVINDSINQINASGQGGTVYIDTGTYVCLSGVMLSPHTGNVMRGVGLVGVGRFSTLLSFEPTGGLTDGILCTMSNAKISDLRVQVNSNVTNAIRITGNSPGGGDRGNITDVEVDGPNAHTTGAPISGQIGINHDGTTASPFWWSFHNITIRSFGKGVQSSGDFSTSMQWTNCNFHNNIYAMHIAGKQNQGSNLWIQGSPDYGRHGISIHEAGYANQFSNIYAEIHQSGVTAEAVHFESGANFNMVMAVRNEYDPGDGNEPLTVRNDEPGNSNLFIMSNTLEIRDLSISGTPLVRMSGQSLQIGRSATQKVGFFGDTPIVQPSASADPSNALSGCKVILNVLRGLGLMDT